MLTEAISLLSPDLRSYVEAWLEQRQDDARHEHLRNALRGERHLPAEPFAVLLEAVAGALAAGRDPVAAFDAAAASVRLRGDEPPADEVEVLHRVVSRDALPRATGTPAWLAGHLTRMGTSRLVRDWRAYDYDRDGPAPPEFAAWWLAGGPIVWATPGPPSDVLTGPQWYEFGMTSAALRDVLGLSHYRRGTCLAVMTYLRPARPVRNPTVADAGSAHRDFVPCGHAKDLATGGTGRREVVHANVRAGELLRIVNVMCEVR